MRNLVLVALLVAVWPLSGGKTYHFTADRSVPGANGTVTVKVDKNNQNAEFEVRVKSLARPTDLTPPENVYVVWVRSRSGTIEKAGAIHVSKDLTGELRATTTAKNFDIFITAEQSDSVTEPSELELLQAHVDI